MVLKKYKEQTGRSRVKPDRLRSSRDDACTCPQKQSFIILLLFTLVYGTSPSFTLQLARSPRLARFLVAEFESRVKLTANGKETKYKYTNIYLKSSSTFFT